MSAIERALDHLRAIGRSLPHGVYKLGGAPPADVQARIDALTPEERARAEKMCDEMIDGLYERCGISRVKQ
jgi:hypothetical protein